MTDFQALKRASAPFLVGTAVALGGVQAAMPSPAAACGGLFCNASQPVNQAAEKILFVENGDDTVTAIIQIQYQGPSEKFAWVLPIAGIENPDEDIRVSSELALDRLQQATNPTYMLQTRFEDGCAVPLSTMAGRAFSPQNQAESLDSGAIIVEASGSVGPFDYELIQVDPTLADPAQAAVDWLEENGYDIDGIGADLLRPYLESEDKLLAVRLTKGNDAGSIRPLAVTYTGDKPSIPIRPTAVAANDDMPILVWVAGSDRAIPLNYHLLELNEALIDWFNPMDTYNDVVSAAADEAGGHGWVTEYADSSDTLADVIVPSFERANWSDFSAATFSEPVAMLQQAAGYFSSWDGFQDAFRAATTVPDGAGFDVYDVLDCPNCYLGGDEGPMAQLDMEEFRRQLYELVVRPMLETDDLLLSQPYVTRLYTTMSADEMNEDPLFDFNPDLDSVSNVHIRERVMKCDEGSSWEVRFENDFVVRGGASGSWPIRAETTSMPAALRIFTVGPSGPPVVMVDNASMVASMLDETNTGGPAPAADSDEGSGLFCSVRTPGTQRTAGSAAPLLIGLLLWSRRRRHRVVTGASSASSGRG